MPNSLPGGKLLKIGQAAKVLGVSIETLRRWEKSGKLQAVKTSGGTRFYSSQSLKQVNPKLFRKHTQPQPTYPVQPPPASLSTDNLNGFLAPHSLPVLSPKKPEVAVRGIDIPSPKLNFKYKIAVVSAFSLVVFISGFIWMPAAFSALTDRFFTSASTQQDQGNSNQRQREVLAASVASRYLQINADMEIKGALSAGGLTISSSDNASGLTVGTAATFDGPASFAGGLTSTGTSNLADLSVDNLTITPTTVSSGTTASNIPFIINSSGNVGIGTTSTNTYKVNLSGSLNTTGATTTILKTNSNSMTIGRTTTFYSDSLIDQVRIFNYARTAAQVAWDYNKGKPVGYWDLDECQGVVAHDSAIPSTVEGTGNNGTITVATGNALGTCNTASTFWGGSTGTGAGKRNYAPTFDGTDDNISVTDPGTNSVLDFSSDFSISLWDKIDAFPTNNVDLKQWIGKGAIGETASTDHNFYFGPAKGTFGLSTDSVGIAGGYENGSGTNTNVAYATSETGVWRHWTFIYSDSANTITIFRDGIQVAQNTSATNTPNTQNQNITIGSLYPAANYYDGQIDDVQVFNYALTNTQVKNLYNNGAVNFAPSTGAP